VILTITLNPSVDRAIYVKKLLIGDTNRVERTETDAGGKGINLSRVAAELGAETLATGFVGGGPGGFVKAVLKAEGIPYDFVAIAGETRINFSVEDESEDPPTTFNERGPQISQGEWEALLSKCDELGAKARWACVGGSVPPGLGPEVYRKILERMRALGANTLLDADGEALSLGLQARPDLAKPNDKEAERLLGYEVDTDDDALRAAQDVRGLGAATVIVSRGEKGAVLSGPDGSWVGRSPTVEVQSTIGSGDSMLAGYLWALEDGRGVEEAFRWGLAAGAATALTSGSEIARKPVIVELFPQCTTKAV
jgi:1-phosphofructokinase family hexose kinase